MGVPKTEDFNNLEQEGVGYFQLSTHNGLRCSAAVAYLKPIRSRKNLTIITDAQASKVLFEGRKAVGIEFIQAGQRHNVKAHHEVLLSAGAIQSPQLLQLSGIGPAPLLQEFGIPLLHDSLELARTCKTICSIA